MKCSSSKNLLKKIGFLNAGRLTVFLFLAMLVSPDIVFTGAADGLLLWFNTIFPTLFPFMFITAILLKSGGLNIIANVLGKPLGKIFSVSAGKSPGRLRNADAGKPPAGRAGAPCLPALPNEPRISAPHRSRYRPPRGCSAFRLQPPAFRVRRDCPVFPRTHRMRPYRRV